MKQISISILIIGTVLLRGISAYPTFTGCGNLSDQDFVREVLVGKITNDQTLMEPLKMDFLMDETGNVNLYFIERRGAFKYYDASTGIVSLVGTVPDVRTDGEDGLVGMALDPGFRENGHVYFYYSSDLYFRVSRFTVSGDNTLNIGSEVVMIEVISFRGRWHTGGAMRFDAYGDLWIAFGDNEASELGPANSAELRGDIVRIHPEDDGSYTIPDGNLWEFAAAKFEAQGETAIAAEYRNPDVVKREIFAMGHRNPYTLTLDPVRRWAAYGDCGPDVVDASTGSNLSEEQTVVTEPSFNGWPYFAGRDFVHPIVPNGYDETGESWWGDKNFQRPENHNPGAAGVDVLLPASPATRPYPRNCAMTGPIYRYDGSLDSDVKFPPHFNRKWFVTDFNSSWIKSVTLDESGKNLLSEENVFEHLIHNNPLDMQMGPDGALYVNNYSNSWSSVNQNTAISRIIYTGTCRPATPVPEKAGCADNGYVEFDADVLPQHNDPRACITPVVSVNSPSRSTASLAIAGNRIQIRSAGPHAIRITDAAGHTTLRNEGTGPRSYTLPRNGAGLHFVSVTTEEGTVVKRIINME